MIKRIEILFFIFTLFCIESVAQSLTDTIRLPAISIEAKKTSIPASFKALDFDSSTLAGHDFQALSDLLSGSSPVYVKEYGLGGLASLALRGTAAKHTQVYWNGMSLNSPMLGQVDFSLFPVTFLNQLELHAGAGSIMDGSGGLGGSLHLANVPDWENQWQFMARSQAASFSTYTQQARLRWGDKRWQFHTTGYLKSAENDFEYRDYHKDNILLRRQNAQLNQGGAMQEVYYKPDERNTFSVRAWYVESDRNLPAILGSESNAERQEDASLRTMLEWERRGYHYLLENKAAYMVDRLDYFNDTLSLKSKSDLSSLQWYTRYTHYLGSRLMAKMQLQVSHDVAASTGYENAKTQEVLSHLAGITWYGKQRRLSVDLYSRQELRNYNDLYWIPAFGANYRLFNEKDWMVKASASRNIRYPTLNDLYWDMQGNPDLKVEQSRSVEAGIQNGNIPVTKKASLSVELTAFHSLVDHWIIWQPAGNTWRPENLRKVENKGIETALRYENRLGKSVWTAGGGYTYTSSRNLVNAGGAENTVGKQLIYVPFHKVNSYFSIKRNGWYTWYRHTVTDKVFIDAVNVRYLPWFSHADLAVGKELKWKENVLSCQFTIRNLYDSQYQVIAERPMPGRYYTVSVGYLIGKAR